MLGSRRSIKPSGAGSDSPPDGLAPPPSPRRLPPPGDHLHAQRARLGLRDRRAQPAGLRPHAQRAGDDGAVAVHPAGTGARRTGGHRPARSCRRPPRAALAVSRRGRRSSRRWRCSRPSPWLPLVLVLAAADGILALVGRALTRGAVAATLKPDGQLEAGNTLLNVSFSLCFAIGPAIGGLVIAAWGVSAGAVGERRDLRRDDRHAGHEPRAAARARGCRRGWLARVRAGISHALGNPRRAPHLLRPRGRAHLRRDDLAGRGHLGQGGPRRRQQRLRHRPQRLGRGHAAHRSASSSPLWRRLPVVDAHPAGRRDDGRRLRRHDPRHLAAGRRAGLLHRRPGQRLLLRLGHPGHPGADGRRVPGPRHGPARVDDRRRLRRRVPAGRRHHRADLGARDLRGDGGRRDPRHDLDGHAAARATRRAAPDSRSSATALATESS